MHRTKPRANGLELPVSLPDSDSRGLNDCQDHGPKFPILAIVSHTSSTPQIDVASCLRLDLTWTLSVQIRGKLSALAYRPLSDDWVAVKKLNQVARNLVIFSVVMIIIVVARYLSHFSGNLSQVENRNPNEEMEACSLHAADVDRNFHEILPS